MFENFWGNARVTESLEQMIAGQRLPQTLLFSGPRGRGQGDAGAAHGGALARATRS